MKDRWALCALGGWLMGSVIMFVVATRNFRLVDELLRASPNASFQALVAQTGAPAIRDLLRYLSSELNREYFRLWNLTQLALGVLAAWLLAHASERRARRLVLAALALVAVLLAGLTPPIISVGRSLDFVPRDPPPPALATFWPLHIGYTVLDLAKTVLIGLAAYWTVRSAKRD